jgi:hypothetical protein
LSNATKLLFIKPFDISSIEGGFLKATQNALKIVSGRICTLRMYFHRCKQKPSLLEDCTPSVFYVIRVLNSCPSRGFILMTFRIGVRRSEKMTSWPGKLVQVSAGFST